MGWIRNFAIGIIFLGIFQSCFNPPEYPVTPQIEFEKIQFKDVTTGADSLILTLRFKDGDGDLGLNDQDLETLKFAEKYYYRLPNGKLLNYATKRAWDIDNNVANDTLPFFVAPFNCNTWEVITFTENNVTKRDTLWTRLNPNHYNIFVDFFVKNANGSFSKFDPQEIFIYPNCVVNLFNGRFPILSKNPNQESPLEGTIRYSMRSEGFNIFFSIRTIKLKIRIQDRALNKSNEIETPEFTLQSIR